MQNKRMLTRLLTNDTPLNKGTNAGTVINQLESYNLRQRKAHKRLVNNTITQVAAKKNNKDEEKTVKHKYTVDEKLMFVKYVDNKMSTGEEKNLKKIFGDVDFRSANFYNTKEGKNVRLPSVGYSSVTRWYNIYESKEVNRDDESFIDAMESNSKAVVNITSLTEDVIEAINDANQNYSSFNTLMLKNYIKYHAQMEGNRITERSVNTYVRYFKEKFYFSKANLWTTERREEAISNPRNHFTYLSLSRAAIFQGKSEQQLPKECIANIDYCGIKMLSKEGPEFEEIHMSKEDRRSYLASKHMSHFISFGSMVFMDGDYSVCFVYKNKHMQDGEIQLVYADEQKTQPIVFIKNKFSADVHKFIFDNVFYPKMQKKNPNNQFLLTFDGENSQMASLLEGLEGVERSNSEVNDTNNGNNDNYFYETKAGIPNLIMMKLPANTSSKLQVNDVSKHFVSLKKKYKENVSLSTSSASNICRTFSYENTSKKNYIKDQLVRAGESLSHIKPFNKKESHDKCANVIINLFTAVHDVYEEYKSKKFAIAFRDTGLTAIYDNNKKEIAKMLKKSGLKLTNDEILNFNANLPRGEKIALKEGYISEYNLESLNIPPSEEQKSNNDPTKRYGSQIEALKSQRAIFINHRQFESAHKEELNPINNNIKIVRKEKNDQKKVAEKIGVNIMVIEDHNERNNLVNYVETKEEEIQELEKLAKEQYYKIQVLQQQYIRLQKDVTQHQNLPIEQENKQIEQKTNQIEQESNSNNCYSTRRSKKRKKNCANLNSCKPKIIKQNTQSNANRSNSIGNTEDSYKNRSRGGNKRESKVNRKYLF